MLSSGKKLILLLLVAISTATAILFAKRTAPVDAPEPREILARRLPDHAPLPGATSTGTPTLGTPSFGSPRHLVTTAGDGGLKVPTASTPGSADLGLGMDFEPQAAAGYGRTFNPAGALLQPHVARARNTLDLQAEPDLPIGNPSASSRSRTHTVVDGDTLSKLAARYLGSSERYRELFEANRPLLASPDLLPIGAVLQIPSAPALSSSQLQPAETTLPAESTLPFETALPVETGSAMDLDSSNAAPRMMAVPKGALRGDDD